MRETAKQPKKADATTKRGSDSTKAAARSSARKRKELTAKEATLRAWQKTYENRHKRLA
jgi:hypothetical protein